MDTCDIIKMALFDIITIATFYIITMAPYGMITIEKSMSLLQKHTKATYDIIISSLCSPCKGVQICRMLREKKINHAPIWTTIN